MWRAYVRGFAAGLGTAALLAVAGTGWLVERGVRARIDTSAVAREVRPAIERQVALLLPGIIAELKRETPPRVAAELARMLDSSGITIYGVEIHLPPESMQEVRRQVEAVVSRELARSLDQIDVASSARYWGAEGERILAHALERHLRDRTFQLALGFPEPWLSFPVTLDPRPAGP